MTDSIKVSAKIRATPKQIYDVWMDSKKHGAMTEAKAVIDPKIGGKFTAYDDDIQGTTIELELNKKIVQKWRNSDFPPKSPDSKIEILLEEEENGTKITISQTDLPEGTADEYKDGWKDFYFEPMQEYFKKLAKKKATAESKKTSKKSTKCK